MRKSDKYLGKWGLLAVMACSMLFGAGCDDVEYEDDYRYRESRHERHHEQEYGYLRGEGRIKFKYDKHRKYRNIRVTAHWDHDRRSRVVTPDRDGYFYFNDLPRDEKITVVAIVEGPERIYKSRRSIRTPRRGRKCDLGTFKKFDRKKYHHPKPDHHRHNWRGEPLRGGGRLLFGNKGCNMTRVTAYWDGQRRSRESNIPDKDGYFIIRDLPRDKKVTLIAEFDYYNQRYFAKEKIRTPRHGGRINLGTLQFQSKGHHHHHGVKPRPRPYPKPKPYHKPHHKPHYRENVRVQGWVTYKGAAVDNVQVYSKSKRRPAWRKVSRSNRVGKFDVRKVPADEKVEFKFIKDTPRGTYSAKKAVRTKRENRDMGSIKLKYSEKKQHHKKDARKDLRKKKHRKDR